ncbi:MAG: N-acetylmuramoyl-L-alanine amidase [Bacteroidales bacterium]|nr:MAG: N-acetylmuramoyl-L-alanine amidase [Bacteroidales bacterium]
MTFYRLSDLLPEKRLIQLILVLPVIYLLFISSSGYQDYNEKNSWTVVIDPGHGGKDPGALGRISKEKDIVLGVGLKLGNYIERNFDDVEVIYTRKTDEFIELDRRAEIANKAKADLFISLHANSWENRNIAGSETYAMGLHTDARNLEVAMKENAVITFEENYTTKYEGYDPESPESFIVFSLMQNTFLEQSLQFASYVQTQFRDRAKRIDRGIKQAGFIVLWRTTMPSVLIEIGYISNSNEEKYMISDTGQDYIASAVFRAFREYKNAIERKSDFSQAALDTTRIHFMVQISASKRPIPAESEYFKDLDDVKEFKTDKLYKYAVGNEYSYDEIMKYIQIIKTSFPDAFIIAVRNEKIIPLREALNEINE